MANKTWYIRNATASGSSHGSLSDSTQGSSTTGTGWTVGTTAPTVYSLMQYGTERSTASFGATVEPASPPTTNDCWRTESTIRGVIAGGTWTFSTLIISSTAAASGSGKIFFRLWKSSNATGTSATEITSGSLSGNWSNVGTVVGVTVSATTALSEISLNNEYLFLQMAASIDSASANASADLLVRTDNTSSKIVSPELQFMHDVYLLSSLDSFTCSVDRGLKPIDIVSDFNVSEIVYYTMRAKYQSSYKIWEVAGNPDTTGSQSGVNPLDLSDIVVINTKKAIA